VVAHLIDRALEAGRTPREAMAETLDRLRGAFAFAILFEGEDDLMIGARRGSPLAVGHGEGAMYLGSDAIALAPFTNRVTYLEDGDWVVLTRQGLEIYDSGHRPVERAITYTQGSNLLADKGGHRHFMAKEIAEQPDVVGRTLAEYLDFGEGPGEAARGARLRAAAAPHHHRLRNGVLRRAGGALLVREAGAAAGRGRYRVGVPLSRGAAARQRAGHRHLAVGRDRRHACRAALLQGAGPVDGGIVNVAQSTIARDCDVPLQTFAGPEIGVASTKAFTCQLAVLASLAIAAGRARGTISRDDEARLVNALAQVPRHMSSILAGEKAIAGIARRLAHARDVLYLGRGINYPLALEGALKLKEISYIHAEGYAAGELKHGPIALIDEDVPVVVIAPRDDLFDKTMSNMEEVAARGGRIVLITDEKGAAENGAHAMETIAVPEADPFISPFLYALPVQLLAYHAAVFLGTDVDQPRNLAKSVTVE
jgi:glutamine---fructose-6-phosphate transaminase (isomerizing)